MSKPASITLVDDPAAVRTGRTVITGFTQGAHGRVSLLGAKATYTPEPGYAGTDSFRYTISDAAGTTWSSAVEVGVAALAPSCTIALSGPSSAVIGPAIHLTATASCNFGTPQIQWQHRLPGGTFATFKNFSTATAADFNTTNAVLGDHQFMARVRIQGTTMTFISNTVTTKLLAAGSPCTAVVLDAPAASSVFATGQAITLHGTATCPAGITPEYQYWVKQATDTDFTVLPGYFPDATSYTPAQGGSWVFVAAARGVGSSLPFEVQSAEVPVTVSHAPVAVDDTLAIDEDGEGSVDVLANDSDPDGDPLTAAITTPPVAGMASISGGVVTYYPVADYHGEDAVGYTVSDGHGNTASATLHIAIHSINDPPSGQHDFITVAEDGSVAFDPTANDIDVDGDALTVTAITLPSHGTATLDGNLVTYVPDHNYSGSDYLEYTISDGHDESSTASIFLTVTGGNDAPIAVDDQLTTAEDTPGSVFVLGNDGDPDGDSLTVVAFDQPAHGSVSLVAGFATYVPNPDFNGADAFTYTVADPSGATSSATVHVTVTPVNDPPVAADDSASTDEDTAVTIDAAANDRDVDGDVLTIASVTQPAHGAAEIVAGGIRYTPAADYHGGDAFGYTIADPSGATASATVTVAIASVNDPPVAVADAASVDEDAAVTIDAAANDSDVDGDALAITAVTQPVHGTAAIVDATHVAYTPAPNYHGSDAFSYTISDGHGGEASAGIAIAVNPVNDAPVAVDDSVALDEDTAVAIAVAANDSDADSDALAITAVTQPAHGVVEIVDATHVAYTPAPNYHGPDGFSYTIGDGNGGTASAAVAITVNPVNDAPVAQADAATVLEDTAATIDAVANDSDVDGDALAIASVTQPAHGAVTILDPHHVVYTPAANYHGGDAFSYTIADPSGAQATAQVAVDVVGVNDAPVAADDAASTNEDTSVTVDVVANDSDVDGDALAIASISQPAHGVAIATDAHHVLYIPAPDYHGPDALGYTISDGNGGQATAQLALDVISVNDAPVAVDDAAGLDEDTQVTVDVVGNDSDVDGDTLGVTGITQPAHGTAAIVGLRQVSYVPAANYNGADSFRYTIDDGHGAQATATVALTVASVNDAPVAADDAATTDEDTAVTVDVVANDSDVDGDTLTVAGVTQPAHGAAAIVDGHHVIYTPAANYNGADAFQYTIGDGTAQATATVAITVAAINDAPVASDGTLATFDDTSATATLAATDVDGDPVTFAIATPPAHGTLGPVAGNHVAYTPAAGFAGNDAFTFVATDGQASSAPATIQVVVTRSVCGNGVREGVHEECDDGNATPGDGCEATCKLTCGSGTGADRSTVDAASGHCFAAFDGVQHGYQQAAAMCAALGGHLPTLTSASEDAAAFAAVRAGDTPWLGADDIAVEGTFSWTTGEPSGYSHFHAGKPDNAGNADCVQYLADGTWSDAACSGTPASTGTLCELELAAATPAFATGGGGTKAVAVADVNGDGYADIAAINPANNTVGVLLGNGAGGFVLQATYATGNGPAAIAAGDFDRDGHPDLAVLNATASTISILRGTASGAFVAGATVSVASGSTSLAAADFDQDGVLDLAVAASATVRLLHGDGNGGFTGLGSLAITGVPASIAAGDFNHDGRIDLVLTTPLAVLVVMGSGGGLFGLPVTLALSTNNRAIAIGDLDGDGNLDLAIANGAATVSVFFGTGSGGFGAPSSLTVAGTPLLVAAGDFDGDGGIDLVALTASFATLFHGAGRTFTPAGPIVATGGGGVSAAAVISANADTAADLVVANAGTSNAGLLLGGAGGFAGARALPVGTATTSSVSADFNQDGRADLAIVDPVASKVFVFLQTAAGTLAPSATITLVSGGNQTYLLSADIDGDGKLDLVVVNVGFQSVSVLLGAGNGTFGAPLNSGTAGGPRRPAVGDFNGDGRLDLAVPAANGNVVSILINTGGGRFGRSDVAAGSAPAAAVVGDFNGDGKKDIAVAFTGEADVKLLLGHGDSTFSAAVAFPVTAAGQAIAAGDFDGDGKLDVAVTNTTTATVSILRGTGTGSFAAATTIGVGSQPAAVVAVDLDGDARTDLVVGNAGSGDVTVLHNTGTGGFVASIFGVGAPVSWVCVADLDRDGHLDIVASSSNPFVATLYSAR